MKNLKKKKGFTLIELMIVLAIIAILAVVLVPKASIFKSQAKNAGVMTNVNTIRAYLESKTGDNFTVTSTATTLTDFANATSLSFNGEDVITNPFSNLTTINNTANTDTTGATAQAVYLAYASSAPTALANYAGSVIVLVDASGKKYTVYGIDKGGNKTTKSFEIK
jgi:type IV pilus assembly protein PilA